MSNTKYFCTYDMERPLSVEEAAFSCGVTRQRIYQLLKNGIVKNSEVREFPIDGKSLLKWTSARPVSLIPGTSLITYSLKGLIEASGRGRSYVLKMVDVIFSEDTRVTLELLNHFDIHTPMTSYHEYNKVDKAKELVQMINETVNNA